MTKNKVDPIDEVLAGMIETQLRWRKDSELLDLFAALAMHAILSSAEVDSPGMVVREAYGYADAMLAERERRRKERVSE